MDKIIEKIIERESDKCFLAYFQYSHPVIVLHLSYEAEETDEKYALKRFLIRILDDLYAKGKPVPVCAVAHLCGVDIHIINKILRDMCKDQIVTLETDTYKVLASTKETYLANEKPRKKIDRDFVIDSKARDELPLPVYDVTNGFPQVSYRKDFDLDAVGMTANERDKYKDKLEKQSEKRKLSLGFPADADNFYIDNTTEAQLSGFYAIYFIVDGKLIKQVYFGDRLIEDSSFAKIAALQFGLGCKDRKFVKERNMPIGQLYAMSKDEINSIITKEFGLDTSCKFIIRDKYYECGVTMNIVEQSLNRGAIFQCLDEGHKDYSIHSEKHNCGEARMYFRCEDDEVGKLLNFYSSTKNCRDKESVIKVAENLHLSWRKALVMTGRLGLLEDIDIKDYII